MVKKIQNSRLGDVKTWSRDGSRSPQ